MDSDSEEDFQDAKEEDLGVSDSWVSEGSSEDSDSVDSDEALVYEQKSKACVKLFEDGEGVERDFK